jgi:hypothetical protein
MVQAPGFIRGINPCIANRKSSSPRIDPWGQSKIENRKSKIENRLTRGCDM